MRLHKLKTVWSEIDTLRITGLVKTLWDTFTSTQVPKLQDNLPLLSFYAPRVAIQFKFNVHFILDESGEQRYVCLAACFTFTFLSVYKSQTFSHPWLIGLGFFLEIFPELIKTVNGLILFSPFWLYNIVISIWVIPL